MTVSVDSGKTLIGVSSGTWAARLATPPDGTLYFATDVGEAGTIMLYSAALARWRALNGMASLKTLAAAVTGVVNAETIVLQASIPAGLWQPKDIIRIWASLTKSGGTDAAAMTVRIGTLGTTGDTVITGLNAFATLNTTGLSGGGVFDIRQISATSVQKLGASQSNGASYTSLSSGGSNAATTVTDASANALIVSVAVQSAGATNTVGVDFGQIQLITQ